MENELAAAVAREFFLVAQGYSLSDLAGLTPKGVRVRATVIGEILKTAKEKQEA